MFKPLQITFFLNSGIMSTYPFIYLDGLLLYRAMEVEYGSCNLFVQKREYDPVWDTVDIPIERVYFKQNANAKDQFYYRASIGRYDNSIHISQTSIHKFFDYTMMKHCSDQKKTYNLAGGPFKLRKVKYPIINTKTITFWVKGDLAKLQDMLQYIPYIGKKGTSGFGKIDHFEITECEQDHSCFHPLYGTNRPIPTKSSDIIYDKEKTVQIANVGFKPPNWAVENQTLCILPQSL